MHYDPRTERPPLRFDPFKSCTVPRPIGWLSTISASGVVNLAPFSQWQNLTFDPPMVMFAANRYPDGRRKDTVVNAQTTGWFVWNMATWRLREAVNISAIVVAPALLSSRAARPATVSVSACALRPGGATRRSGRSQRFWSDS